MYSPNKLFTTYALLNLVIICAVTQNPWNPLTMAVMTSELRHGDQLNIECTYETPYMTILDDMRTFSWMRDEIIIFDGSRKVNYQDGRYVVMTEPNWAGINSLLTVSNLTREDEGNYSCVFDENGATATSDDIRLYYPPSDGYPGCSFKVEDGEPFGLTDVDVMELDCVSDGFPRANLTWHVRSRDGTIQPMGERRYVRDSFVHGKFRLVLDHNLNGRTFVCMSILNLDSTYFAECELGPIFVANPRATAEDSDVTPYSTDVTSTLVPSTSTKQTTVGSTTNTPLIMDSDEYGVTYLSVTTGQDTDEEIVKFGVIDPLDNVGPAVVSYDSSNSDDSYDIGSVPLRIPNEPRASIECECKFTQDFLQLSFFVLIPVLILSIIINALLCVRAFRRPKQYQQTADTGELTDMAVLGNRRTETIMRNERETASNDYSLGDIYAAIEGPREYTVTQETADYRQNCENTDDDDFDDDGDYFDGDIDGDYAHEVYDEPPEEEETLENGNFYFDVPSMDSKEFLPDEVIPPPPSQYK